MTEQLAGVVLAAGSGTRLRPLTELKPKALCPVGNKALVDWAVDNITAVTPEVVANAWHMGSMLVEHVGDRVRVQLERNGPLGTAGALGALHDWIDGRPAIVHNADAWHRADLTSFVDGWDGERIRLLVRRDAERGDFDDLRFCGVSLMPWSTVSTFEPHPSGLWKASWKAAWQRREIDFVIYDGPYFDCGTPADYLQANLVASGGENVVGEGSVVDGRIERCVLWENSYVGPDENLSEVIRVGSDLTVEAALQLPCPS